MRRREIGEKRGTGWKGATRGAGFDVLGSKFQQLRISNLPPVARRVALRSKSGKALAFMT
jgi:hypothetical protein